MALYSRPCFRQDSLPCRVIDVDGTLGTQGSFRFCEAYTIRDFCVVSHMWNDHVTGLMEDICKRIDNCTYAQAVEATNWAGLEATSEVYLSIRKFLEVLQERGVKKIWIDTLCIDQSKDSREKSREIPLMGAYYRHSSACYVPVNGFGLNYELCKGEIVTKQLPWINRVWTLQEFLLPDKIYFLLEVEEWMERWLALRVATARKGLIHFCSCCVEELHFMPTSIQKATEKAKDGHCQLDVIRKADLNQSCCSECASPPLLTKALKQDDNSRLYWVQREALFAVAYLALYHEQVQRGVWQGEMGMFEKFAISLNRHEWLRRIMQAKRHGTWFSSFEFLDEIRCRGCKFDRDRVLGVLGLLGVNGAANNSQQQQDYELSDAETPEKQLAELASRCAFTDQLLVEICWMDEFSGRCMAGMSWIPDLTGRVSKSLETGPQWDNMEMKKFHSKATNVSVAAEGPITLTVKVLKGYMKYLDDKNLVWKAITSEPLAEDRELRFMHRSLFNKDYTDNPWFSYFKRFHPKKVACFNRDNPADIIDETDRLFGGKNGTIEHTFDEDGSLSLPFKNPRPFRGFEMWLIHLGDFCGYSAVLLCLRNGAKNEVHKIGTLHASYLGMRKVLDDLKDPPQKVTIGGYEYLDDHVDY